MSRYSYLGLCLLAVSYAYSDFGRCGSINGIELPCWRDFLSDGEGDASLPRYPYAKREDGCSIPNTTPGDYDNFLSGGYNFSFRGACNEHDRCYHTLGSKATECNNSYFLNLNEVCTKGIFQAPNWYDLLGGIPRANAVAACFARAEIMWGAVASNQTEVHGRSQQRQIRYFEMVQQFLDENYDGVFPVIKNRAWTGHGIADRWEFAKLFEKNRDVYVTHRNNGTFYANQYNLDGTVNTWTWAGGHGIADRFAFTDVFGTGRDVYVTHRNNGEFYVTQLNKDNTKKVFPTFKGGHGIANRMAFADVFNTGRKQYVTHRNDGYFFVTQLNENNTLMNWTISGGYGIADRWQFAKVFGDGTDIYVTHRNNGQFYTTRLNRDGTITNRTMSGGHGIADRFAFADIFGTGRDIYVTHRNNGQFYASQINEDGTVKNWSWTTPIGIGDRWGFTDFLGNGRQVYVTHKNDGTFYIVQLNENGTHSSLTLRGGNGIADRWKFANIFGKKSTAYATHRNNGNLHSSETNNGLVISEPSLSGGVKTFQFDVPSDGDDLKIEMAGGTGDADLYVRKGSAPTLTSYDCRPYSSGNTEKCEYRGPAGGRYYIMLNPYSNYTGVSLQVQYKP